MRSVTLSMRKKVLLLLLILVCSIPFTLGARNLFNVSLGFGAAYYPDEEGFFGPSIQDADNWRFHGELSARFWILQANALVFPVQCDNGGQGVLMVGMGTLSLPVIGSFFSLELGGGVGATYIPASSDASASYYVLADGQQAAANEIPFGDALWRSPIYLHAGLASELGPIGLRLRYLSASKASLHTVFGENAWWDIFNTESGALSLVLSLRMF